MDFRIADTFTDSLARLTGDEQKAVKTTAFDLQLNPASPGMSFHKLDKAKDKRFWSVRVSSDLRLIVHRTADSLLLCYVDHHDKAYAWAERRKLETHPDHGRGAARGDPRAGAGDRRPHVRAAAAGCRLRNGRCSRTFSDEELLGYGVPAEWLADVRQATEDTVLALADHLPAEAAEALLELATGGTPRHDGLRPAGGRPIRAPRRAAPLPRGDRRGGAGARAGVSVGALDGLPAPRAARAGGAALRRARRASPARPAQGRPSSRSTARRTWPAPIPMRASSLPPSRRRWRARYAPSSPG